MNRSTIWRRLAAFLATALAITCLAPSAEASVTWDFVNYFNGQSTGGYVPPFQSLGTPNCYPFNGGSAYWLQFVGPYVDPPRTSNDFWRLPASTVIDLTGSTDTSAAITNGLQGVAGAGDEVIIYLPAAYFQGDWHVALNRATGAPQLMGAVNGFPANNSTWMFWRNGEWEEPEVDLGQANPLAAYGYNWDWDAMFVPGPGAYSTGGFVYWLPYQGSDNGNGPFPGIYGFFHENSQSSCGGARIPGPPPRLSQATIRSLEQAAKRRPLHAKLKTYREGRTRPRAGRRFLVASIAKYHHHKVKGGKVYCEASVRLHKEKDEKRLLRPRHRRRYRRWHRRHGLNVCAWRIPRRAKGKKIHYAVHLYTHHHGNTVVSGIKRIKRHG